MIKFINEIVPKICSSMSCQIFICALKRVWDTQLQEPYRWGDALTPYPSWDWLIRIHVIKSFKFYRKSIKSIHWFTKNEMTIYESPEPWCNVLFPHSLFKQVSQTWWSKALIFLQTGTGGLQILQECYTKPL